MRSDKTGVRPFCTPSPLLACGTVLLTFLALAVYYNFAQDSVIGFRPVLVQPGQLGKSVKGETTLGSKSAIETESEAFQSLEAEYRTRMLRYQNACVVRKRDVHSKHKVLYYRNPTTNQSLAFCSVPKAGATFWQRIFQFLNITNKNSTVSSPLDITRFDVYLHPKARLQPMLSNHDLMSNALRFFFVRNPYSRLMSAYIDKFVLPQFLTWNVYGKRLAELRINGSLESRPCVTGLLTFSEFIDHFVLSGPPNPHWVPIHGICDPCTLFPHVIGKQESFSTDVKFILTKVGLQHLLVNYSHTTYIVDEIKQLVDFTYLFRNINGYLRKCFDNVEIASRLWKTFQMNGYLPSGIKFPKSEIVKLMKNSKGKIKEIVTNYITNINSRAGISRDQHSRQKRAMLLHEYHTLSRDSVEKLADMYDVEFRMFGYEKYPKDLFPGH